MAGPMSRCVEMLDRIHRGGMSPEECVRLAKDKGQPLPPLRASGIGSTRTTIRGRRSSRRPATGCWPRSSARTLCWTSARRLEETALSDPYFIDRKLYPNVDFYSGIILRAIGIPTNMFTVCFAIGRLPGWDCPVERATRTTRPARSFVPGRSTSARTRTDYVPMEGR